MKKNSRHANTPVKRSTGLKIGTGTDRRIALLDAAVEQIAMCGTRGMRVDEIARVAGVAPSLIYHHFGSRSELLLAALNHIAGRANEYAKPKGVNAREKLIKLLRGEVQDIAIVRTNSTAWSELRDSAIFDESLRPAFAALTAQWVAEIADLVKLGHEDGSISTKVKPTTAGVQLSVMVEGLSSRWLTGLMTTREARRLIADSIDLLIGPMSD